MSIKEPTKDAADKAREKAIANGMTIVEPAPNLLLIDLDGYEAKAHFQYMMTAAAEYFGAEEVERWKSRSGKGVHVVVRLKRELDAASRVALQAALGSDAFRELLAIACIGNGLAEPSMLFRPPVKETKP